MTDVLIGIFRAAYDLFGSMAPYLLFGYFFAGILHVFIRPGAISAHLGTNSSASVIKAALFGVPLPLCSCAVIPAALSLRKEGASKGAVLSFLISTPTTGIDSILATYSLLGLFFTVYRVAASFITGVLSGFLANIMLPDVKDAPSADVCSRCHSDGEIPSEGVYGRIRRVFTYAYGDLLKDSGPSLIVGILLAGVITFLIPPEIVETHLGYGIAPMLIMLAVGLPMYVCATASIPIAAALMMKGLSPGAAFVFLVAGPATNMLTMSVVAKSLGKRALFIYLFSITVSSIGMGTILNYFWKGLDLNYGISHIHQQKEMIPEWAVLISSVTLGILIFSDVLLLFRRKYLSSKN